MGPERCPVIVLRRKPHPVGHGGHSAGQDAAFIQPHLLKAIFPSAAIGGHHLLCQVIILRVNDGRMLVDRVILRRLIDILDRFMIQIVRRDRLLRIDVAATALVFQHIHHAVAVPVGVSFFHSAIHIAMGMLFATQHDQHFGNRLCVNSRHIHHENQLDCLGFFLIDGNFIDTHAVIAQQVKFDEITLFIPLTLRRCDGFASLMGFLLCDQGKNLKRKIHILIQREHILCLEQNTHGLRKRAEHINDTHTVHQVTGQSAQILHHDDVEFALLRILQHLHKAHSFFYAGRRDSLIGIHGDHLPLWAAAHIVQIVPLLRRKRRCLCEAVRADTAIYNDPFPGAGIERIDIRHCGYRPDLAHIPFLIHSCEDRLFGFRPGICAHLCRLKAAEPLTQSARLLKLAFTHLFFPK